MKKIFNYLKSINSADSPDSSKRFWGGIGFATCVVLACINKELQEPLLYTSAGLLGLETITNFFKPKS